MMNNTVLKGSLFVSAAACCYGLLGIFVKMAYIDGYSTPEVTVSQFALGFISLLILNLVKKKSSSSQNEHKNRRKSYIRMIAAGTSLGFTSICYYMAIKFIPVSIGIVLLLQAVWMSIIVESLLKKKYPGLLKTIAVSIILIGTVLATDVLFQTNQIKWQGILWGLLGAISYTATIYSSNNIELQLPPVKRSFLMITGGFIVVLIVYFPLLSHGFSLQIFISWGIPIAFFGTILPPILFAKGMPLTGMHLGAILTSLEVPVSIICAHFLLGESTSFMQWLGVIFILVAVILINRQQHKQN